MKKVLGREVKLFLDMNASLARDGHVRGDSRAFRLVEPLQDGVYDVMVVNVDTDDEQTVHIDVVITAGSHRGEVVSLQASAMQRDPLDLMGLPASLRVHEGVPDLEIE